MSAQGDKNRNRPGEDPSTRRTAEDELIRGDRGVGKTGDGSTGGSGTAGGGLENEGSGSLLIDDADRAADGEQDENARDGYEDHGSSRDADGTQGESSGSRPGYR